MVFFSFKHILKKNACEHIQYYCFIKKKKRVA